MTETQPPLRNALAVLALLALAYTAVMVRHSAFVASGADSSGYLHFARMLGDGRLDAPLPFPDDIEVDATFEEALRPEGFALRAKHRTMVPRYPMGLPLHMAAAATVLGEDVGPFLITPLSALAGLILMYALGRRLGLEPAWAVAGSVLLAACPIYLFQSLQPMSDVLAAVWVMAAVLAALESRRDVRWAATAGAAFALAVLTRPTNALLIVPILIALEWSVPSLILFGASGFPFAVTLGAWNAFVSGSPFQTGYGDTAAQARRFFHPSYLPAHLERYGRWLSFFLSPLIPAAWLAMPFVRDRPLRDRALLAAWFLPLIGFYGSYRLCEDWTYTRFLLPGIPALILSGLLVARAIARKLAGSGRGRPRRIAAGLLVVACASWAVASAAFWVDKLLILSFHEDKELYPTAIAWADEALPQKAILASHEMSGAITYYTDRPILNWKQMGKRDQRFRAMRLDAERKGYRFYALLHDTEALELGPWVEGKWDLRGTHGAWITLWELRSAQR